MGMQILSIRDKNNDGPVSWICQEWSVQELIDRFIFYGWSNLGGLFKSEIVAFVRIIIFFLRVNSVRVFLE